MKSKNISYDEHFALQVGLNSLLRYNNTLLIPVDEEKIDLPIVEEYFKAKPNSVEEKKCINMLLAAAKVAYLMHPDIPMENKFQCAAVGVKKFHMALEAAKPDYLRETGYFGVGLSAEEKYNEYQKKNVVFRNAALLDNAKSKLKSLPVDVLKKEGIKKCATFVGTTLGIESLAGGVIASIATAIGVSPALVTAAAVALGVIAVDVAWSLVPEKAKTKIKQTAVGMMKKAAVQVDRVTQRLAATPVGKKVGELYTEYVAPVVNRGVSAIVNTYEKAKVKGRQLWMKVKSYFFK